MFLKAIAHHDSWNAKCNAKQTDHRLETTFINKKMNFGTTKDHG